MSLTVPITTGQMMAGAQAFQPGAEGPAQSAAPSATAALSTGSNAIVFGVAGWIAVGLLGVIVLHQWGFRFAHVP
jgi:hypothetical protein